MQREWGTHGTDGDTGANERGEARVDLESEEEWSWELLELHLKDDYSLLQLGPII